MRLGGFFENTFETPEEWIFILKSMDYNAAYCPFRVQPGQPVPGDDIIRDYRVAAEKADILIAEVGAWGRNYMARDARERKQAIEESARLLDMAENFGARCLVNSAGWHDDGADSFSKETFDLIVDTVREIIDAVKPSATFFTLELVPNIFPYSVDSYLDLIKAIDRRGFAVHLDPVNIIDNAYKYYRNTELLKDCFARLGPHIRSCHAKDVIMGSNFIVHLDETRPGLGKLDYGTFIREALKIDINMPIMLEHLQTDEEYRMASRYVRSFQPA